MMSKVDNPAEFSKHGFRERKGLGGMSKITKEYLPYKMGNMELLKNVTQIVV